MKIVQIERAKSAFQQPIDEQALNAKLGEVLAGETIQSVVELGAGLFNNTYRVDTDERSCILKVAPGHRAEVFYNEQMLMRRERTLAPRLQSVSPLVPEYLAFFEVDGRDAFLQSFVDGRLWHDVEAGLTEMEQGLLWEQLGGFAKRCHSVTGDSFGYPAPGVAHDKWSEFILANVDGMVEDCRRSGVYCDEIREYVDILNACSPLLDVVDTPYLLHGDIWPRNVIIEGEGESIRIAAVIDAERAFWGDPISDWVLLLYGVPDAFWQGYGENLIESVEPQRMEIYKGMYFILNTLETTRSGDPVKNPLQWLSDVNDALSL